MNPLAALKEYAFFESMDEMELRHLSEYLRRETFTDGTRLFEENMSARGLYLVVSGEVRVQKEYPDGSRLILARLRGGDMFGEMSLFDGGPHSAAVEIYSQAELLILDRDDFLALMEADPIIALKITVRVAKVLSFRLRTANEKLVLAKKE
jgi:CRP-like cAMP-binding protein